MSEDYSVRQDRQANTSFYPFVVSFEIPLPQTSHPSPNFIKQNLLGKLANPRSPIPDPRSPIPNPQSPIPNPQSPIPNPQSPITNHQAPITNIQHPSLFPTPGQKTFRNTAGEPWNM